ncbi:unnamed protein product [Rangifer tarandus platyrhynchus]|uniref:Uncharacterized protein n=1 Tax=Rangifer tarandus platyrhynchus TaxID=3082113 RepID=A0AC59Z2M9_RANTA
MHRHATQGLRAHGLCLLWLQENPFEPQRLFRKLLEKLRNKSKRRFENERLTGSHQFSSPVLFSEPPGPIKGQLHEEVSPWLLREDRHATKRISCPEIQLRLPPPRPRRPAAPSSGPPGSLTPFLLLALLFDLPRSLPPVSRVPGASVAPSAMALTPYHSRVEAQPRKCLGVSSGAALDLETGSRRDLPE